MGCITLGNGKKKEKEKEREKEIPPEVWNAFIDAVERQQRSKKEKAKDLWKSMEEIPRKIINVPATNESHEFLLEVEKARAPRCKEDKMKEYKKFLTRINHPSKNMLYAMSKGMFYKYELNPFQNEEYFRNLQTPNPIFLKRLDEVMGQFIFNWDDFVAKYKVSA